MKPLRSFALFTLAFVFAVMLFPGSKQLIAAAESASAATTAAPSAETAMAAETAAAATTAAATPAPAIPPVVHWGMARLIQPPTPCYVAPNSEGGPGAPYVVATGVPRVGRSFKVEWTTKPTVPGSLPDLPALLFVALEATAPISLDPAGATDCYSLVPPDFVMIPGANSILRQTGGRVNLDWTPPITFVGVELFGQLFVADPNANPAGYLLSPALHVRVGT